MEIQYSPNSFHQLNNLRLTLCLEGQELIVIAGPRPASTQTPTALTFPAWRTQPSCSRGHRSSQSSSAPQPLLADGQQTRDLKKQPITLASQTEFGSQKQQLLSGRLEQQTWLQQPPALTLQGQHACKPFSHTEELGNSGLVLHLEGFR